MVELGVGTRGQSVLDIQRALDILGFDPGSLDGIYGTKTKRAVAEFQVQYLVTGIVDPHTDTELNAVLQKYQQRQVSITVPVPQGLRELEIQFGFIAYEDTAGGYVTITNDWADRYIQAIVLPVVGMTKVHTKLAGVFGHVLSDIQAEGLTNRIEQFGVWCPRHKMHDPRLTLSTHSWGISCDINWAENPVGQIGSMDPKVVRIFESHGFQWGGRWRNRDDMHFQYCRRY